VTYPELTQLALLPKAGWRFQTVSDDGGNLDCVVGWRTDRDARDVLWIYDRTDCLAMRMLDRDKPVWRYTGDLSSCIAELLALPVRT
jgi:hypothetical protein